MKTCFKKEIVSNPVIVNGAPVAFEVLGQDTGVICLDPDQAGLIAGLNKLASEQRGGVVAISEAQAEELKKKLPLIAFAPKREYLRVMPTEQKPKPRAPGDADPAAVAEPMIAPPNRALPLAEPRREVAAQSLNDIGAKPEFKPRLGRPPKQKAVA